MKAMFFLIILISSTTSYAIPTKDKLMIRSELKVGDQTIFPRMMIFDGEIASVEIDSLQFEVQPSLVGDDTVVMRAKVFKLTDGMRELISSPIVKAKLGQKVTIEVKSPKNNRMNINLKLVAQKTN